MLIVIGMVVIALLVALKKNFQIGVSLGIALMVSMPDFLRISLPGALPELTIQRILLLVILMFWINRAKRPLCSESKALIPWLVLFGVAQVVSLVFSVHLSGSIKYFLSYVMEILVLFIVVSTTFTDPQSIRRLLGFLVGALASVAIVAFLERYRGLNLADVFLFGIDDRDPTMVNATYPHRILFGYAMAMAVPLTLVLASFAGPRRWKWYAAGILVAGGCYFSNSRGPWIGLTMGGILLLVLGSRQMRRRLLIGSAIMACLLMIRPGIRETVFDAAASLFETDTLKGSSAAYRKRLWYVAITEISQDPIRFLFGYGGLSTETMDLSHYFAEQGAGATSILGYTSWDNNYASDLFEFGSVGFLTQTILYGLVIRRLILSRQRAATPERYFIGAVLSACCVFLFALSNVWIFSPQLKSLFWSLTAVGIGLGAPVGSGGGVSTQRVRRQQVYKRRDIPQTMLTSPFAPDKVVSWNDHR